MKRFTTRLPNGTPKIRLDDYLAEWLPQATGKPVSKSKIRTLVMAGGVYVNRHRTKNPSTDLFGGAVLEVYYDEAKMNPSTLPVETLRAVGFKNENIIYEDDWIIVVHKNSGLPTQPTVDPNRANLFDLVKKDRPYLGLHHRLDSDTSGLVLFTKREEANKGVADLFSERKIQKNYQCIVFRSQQSPFYEVGAHFEVKDFLGKISAKNEKSRFGSVTSGGDPAHTEFRVLEKFQSAYWLEAKPHTGRTHQIRVHASELGLPILGDTLYFPKNLFTMISAPRLMLHAYRLEFEHPITGKPMVLDSPLPDDFLRMLGSLRG